LTDQDFPGTNEQVIRAILRYLVEHPDAKDTIEGISKWWRPNGIPECRQDEVQQGLDSLVSKGWLIVRGLSPSQKIYALNKKCIKEIRAYLVKS
jgi:hypothetical protein